MQKFTHLYKKKSKITEITKKEPKLSEQFKKDLIKVRKEVKKGKFTKYNNAKEILDEPGF